jgi:hypothetical protein
LKKLILLAAPAGLLLGASMPPSSMSAASVSATNPAPREGELSSVVAAPKPAHSGHAASAAPAPVVRNTASGYPPCSATVTDRCIQGRGYARRHSGAHAPRRQQLAMRAGERG